MFSGLMSRWITSRACACASAPATSRAMRSAWATGSYRSRESRSRSDSPSRYDFWASTREDHAHDYGSDDSTRYEIDAHCNPEHLRRFCPIVGPSFCADHARLNTADGHPEEDNRNQACGERGKRFEARQSATPWLEDEKNVALTDSSREALVGRSCTSPRAAPTRREAVAADDIARGEIVEREELRLRVEIRCEQVASSGDALEYAGAPGD